MAMLSWDLIVGWIVIVIIVLAARRMNAGDENFPPSEDDG
jgi:hypothetical protein